MFPKDETDAEIVELFPKKIREVEFERIPLSDGVHLSCRYWLPENAIDSPVPAILEYIPYCTRDRTAARDEAMHPYFAGYGYAAIRVDIRGSGESEGVLLGEYLKQEQDDALEVIEWIASQPWCNGKVGMMGKSWGGFNGLQVAARKPEALKCIITVFFTDDRYADDVHYYGGCMAVENPVWAFVMFPAMARPPDPALVGDNWREMWSDRLDALSPWIIPWVKHQRRDQFWKHGSVCEDYSQIEIPVYAIGGWADAYSNPVARLLKNIKTPIRALVGPWGHQYMHQVVPGPKAGFMDLAMRWWDHWLKESETGIMNEPKYRAWVQDSVKPSSCFEERLGYWAGEETWPSTNTINKTMYFRDGNLLPEGGGNSIRIVNSPQTVGRCTPFFGNMGAGDPQDPLDQRLDDSMSVCFDSAPLDKEFSILGAPAVTLEIESDKPSAFICVRLNELRADGSSLLVTYGILNLTHRNSHENIEPLEVGKRYSVQVFLNDIGHTFDEGSQIRIAVSTSFWPIVWPSPQPVKISIHTGSSHLVLPIRPRKEQDANIDHLPPAKHARVSPRTTLKDGDPTYVGSETDLKTGMLTFTYRMDTGLIKLENNGWKFSSKTENICSILPDDPNSATVKLSAIETFGRDEQLDVVIKANQKMTSDETHFFINARIHVQEGEETILKREWNEKIKRDGV